MDGTQPLNPEASAVQAHLTIMQGVVNRMAENSRYCKVWCVTLVSAILVLVARTGESQHALIALAPTFLFLILDTYYLALERAFRDSYSSFVDKLHRGELTSGDLYKVAPSGQITRHFWECLRSFSIWLFYPVVAVTSVLAWLFVF